MVLHAHVDIGAASGNQKPEKLKALGVDETINCNEVGFHKAIYDLYGKPRLCNESGGVDDVVNHKGGDTWIPSLKCLGKNGRVLVCGVTADYDPEEDLRYTWSFGHNIAGSNGWSRGDPHELNGLTRIGKLKPIVDKQYPLEDAQQAFPDLQIRKVLGKVAIVP